MLLYQYTIFIYYDYCHNAVSICQFIYNDYYHNYHHDYHLHYHHNHYLSALLIDNWVFMSGSQLIWNRYTYVRLVNWVIIGWGKGLTPNRWQIITWTNDVLLSWDSWQQFLWNWNQNVNIFCQGNALENIVCKMATVLFCYHGLTPEAPRDFVGLRRAFWMASPIRKSITESSKDNCRQNDDRIYTRLTLVNCNQQLWWHIQHID